MNRRTDKSGREERRYLSGDEIAALLDAELMKPVRRMDMDVILEGLDYFYPLDAQADTAEAEAALACFLEAHRLFRAEGRRIYILGKRRFVLAAVLIVLLLTTVCSALGINIWRVAYEWLSDSLFMHITSEGGVVLQPEETAHRATEIWGDEIYDLMDEYGIDVSLPTWMPEEMEFKHVETVEEEEEVIVVSALYKNQYDESILLTIRYLPGYDTAQMEFGYESYHEADVEIREEIVYDNITYHVLTNIDHMTIRWVQDRINVSLYFPARGQEAIGIIESIH